MDGGRGEAERVRDRAARETEGARRATEFSRARRRPGVAPSRGSGDGGGGEGAAAALHRGVQAADRARGGPLHEAGELARCCGARPVLLALDELARGAGSRRARGLAPKPRGRRRPRPIRGIKDRRAGARARAVKQRASARRHWWRSKKRARGQAPPAGPETPGGYARRRPRRRDRPLFGAREPVKNMSRTAAT